MPIKPVNPKDPEDYISQIDVPERRADIEALDRMIREEGAQDPRIEYGMLVYEPLAALASQKQYISLYVDCSDEAGYVAERYRDRLAKADIGKSCVRFKRLSDLDEEALRSLLREAAEISGG